MGSGKTRAMLHLMAMGYSQQPNIEDLSGELIPHRSAKKPHTELRNIFQVEEEFQ